MSASNIPGYEEMVEVIADKICVEYVKRVTLLFREIEFWESING